MDKLAKPVAATSGRFAFRRMPASAGYCGQGARFTLRGVVYYRWQTCTAGGIRRKAAPRGDAFYPQKTL